MPSIRRRSLLTGAFALASGRAAARNAPPIEAQPAAQREFTTTIQSFSEKARGLTDPRRLDALVSERGRLLRGILGPSLSFQQWICVVAKIPSGPLPLWLTLNVVATPGAFTLLTNGAAPIDVEPASLLVSTLAVDDAVLASGTFSIAEHRGLGAALERADTEFTVPNFLVRFTDLQQPDWLKDLSARSKRR